MNRTIGYNNYTILTPSQSIESILSNCQNNQFKINTIEILLKDELNMGIDANYDVKLHPKAVECKLEMV